MARSTALDLSKRVRRYLRDWPVRDALGASISDSGTAITVNGTFTGYSTHAQHLEIDQEVMTIGSGTNPYNVFRGQRGSTVASHASGASILVEPRFFYVDILDALNSALDATFPHLYKDVVDESLTTAAATYEYNVPTVSSTIGLPLPYIYYVGLQEPGDDTFRRIDQWKIIRGATPKLRFHFEQVASSTIRIRGIQPLKHLSATTDELDALFPYAAEDALVMYAASYLLMSSENERVRIDTGALDDREQANRVGSARSAADANLQRFMARISSCSMPPPSKHMIPAW